MTDMWTYEPCPPPPCYEPPVVCEPEPPPCYVPPVDCEPEPPCPPEPPAKQHADNGWGNGKDGENPGTHKGNDEQKGTKANEFVSDKFAFKFVGR